eukprot:463712_1
MIEQLQMWRKMCLGVVDILILICLQYYIQMVFAGCNLKIIESKNDWYDVPFVKNGYVVTVGNILNRFSNNRYLPLMHRVAITDLNEPRYSVVLFWGPKLNCLVQCLPSICNKETNVSSVYKPVIYSEYITRKVQEISEYTSDSNG